MIYLRKVKLSNSGSGTLPNVEKVYKLYTTDVYGHPLHRNKTTIAAKKNGSFYDLGAIINGSSK